MCHILLCLIGILAYVYFVDAYWVSCLKAALEPSWIRVNSFDIDYAGDWCGQKAQIVVPIVYAILAIPVVLGLDL